MATQQHAYTDGNVLTGGQLTDEFAQLYGKLDNTNTASGFTIIQVGTRSARPSAGTAGRLYLSTDTGQLEYDNGSSWSVVAPPTPKFASLGSTQSTTTLITSQIVGTGLGVSLVAPSDGEVRVWGAATAENMTANDGVNLRVYRSTTGILAAGSNMSGDTTVWDSQEAIDSTVANPLSIAWDFIDSGLTAGTTYYYYLAFAAVDGGTAKVIGGTNSTTIYAQAV